MVMMLWLRNNSWPKSHKINKTLSTAKLFWGVGTSIITFLSKNLKCSTQLAAIHFCFTLDYNVILCVPRSLKNIFFWHRGGHLSGFFLVFRIPFDNCTGPAVLNKFWDVPGSVELQLPILRDHFFYSVLLYNYLLLRVIKLLYAQRWSFQNSKCPT